MTERDLRAALDLLDRQVVDSEGEPVGKVDDVDLVGDPGEKLCVAALLVGPQALGRRLGGRLGNAISGTARRLSRGRGPARIPLESVKEVGVTITLKVPATDVGRPGQLEDWLRRHFIGNIPGSEHASE